MRKFLRNGTHSSRDFYVMFILILYIEYRQNIRPSLSTYVVLTNIECDEVCPPPHRAYYAVVTTASPPAPFAPVP